MDKTKVAYETMLGLAAEFVLDDAIKKFQINRIHEAIDQALLSGDKDTFRQMAQQLQQLRN